MPDQTLFAVAQVAVTDEVELRLLVPACQVPALEEAAARAGLSVAALLSHTVSEFLRTVAGRTEAAR